MCLSSIGVLIFWYDGQLSRHMEPYSVLTFQSDAAAIHVTTIVNQQLGDQAQAISKSLWHLLVARSDGKALGIVRHNNKSGLEEL